MANKPKIQWIVKDHTGKVVGPYTNEAIKNLITRNVISGEEDIARYPGGNWTPLASVLEFYDLVLESLESGMNQASTQSEDPNISSHKNLSLAEKMEANTVIVTRILKEKQPHKEALPLEDLTIAAGSFPLMEFTKTVRTGLSSLSKKIQSFASIQPSKPKKTFDRSKYVTVDHRIPTMTINDSHRVNRQDGENPTSQRLVFLRLTIAGGLIASLIFLALEELPNSTSNTAESKIHLLAPDGQNGNLTPEETTAYIQRVKAAFENDNTSNWIEAQNLLVKVAEAQPTNTEVREYLCLAYKELWTFAYQDAEDQKALNHMAQSTRALNPTLRHGRTCELIRTWLTGRFQEAKSQLEQLIQDFPNVPFYLWLKTDMLISDSDYINGQGFASSLIVSWPEFIRGKILSTQASIGTGRFQEARETLVQILKQNPEHKVAKLMLGEIEYRNFQQEDRAWELLHTGIKSNELVPQHIHAMAYTSLSQLSEKRGDIGSAKKFAEMGFAINPTNETLRALVKKYGGNEENFNEVARTSELVALGDQFVRTGDCLAAQAQYRAAFDLNPKQPSAAVKAARCLNKINQTFQAFEYLKKAIRSNPDYFPAYTLLADYYSQKFDFASAMGVLNQARAFSAEAFEIYKGYALVELRKNNFSGSLGYIARAISIYSTDPEAYVIQSNAHLGSGQFKEAVQAAQKSIEIDPVNVEGQISYARALGALHGELSGIEHLRKLVSENKYVADYKIALATALKELDRFNEALPYFEEIVATEPKNKKAQIGMGECLNGIGKTDAALSSFLTAATFDPTDPEPIVKAGLIYLDSGGFDPAIQQFERALIINKNYPKAHYYIGKAAFLKGDLQKALDSALAERLANPNIVESYLLAAEVYMVTRKYTQCTSEYQEAIKIRPQGVDNYVKLARCNRLSGSYDVAQSMLEIAAEKESGYPEIYKERGALYQVQGEKEAALRAYEKYLALSPNAMDKKDIENLMAQLSVR